MARFSPTILLDALRQGPNPSCYIIGYSGGLDSTTLLHALRSLQEELAAELKAIHFNHGVNPKAEEWQSHCETNCHQLGIPLQVVPVQMDRNDLSNFEERARDFRYASISRMLGDNDVYLTAHHRDDQAETLLINLARGAGLQGMSGIPQLRRLGSGWVMRPLLGVGREDLRDYARAQQFDWVEDSSNQDERHDRNFVRHQVLPLLEQRWPGASARLAKSADHARNSADLLGRLIEAQQSVNLDHPITLPLRMLGDPEQPDASVLIRHWLRKHEAPHLPASQLSELLRQLSRSAGAEIRWANWVLRRYRDYLWLHEDVAFSPCPDAIWNEYTLDLGKPWGTLELVGAKRLPENLSVRSRREGDRFRPGNGAPSRSFKNVFQQAAIPPWLRDAIPVTCLNDTPVAVGDWAISRDLKDRLLWRPANPILQHAQQLAHATKVDPS